MIKNKSKFAPKNPERGREDLKRMAIPLMTDFFNGTNGSQKILTKAILKEAV